MNSRQMFARIGLTIAVLSLSACGFLEMPNKMDTTNNKMDDMSSKMTTTNNQMGQMQSQLAKTNEQTEKMNEAVHRQTLDVAKNDMLSAASTQVPDNPAAMTAAGQIFADTATPLEIVQFVQATLFDINQSQPDGSTQVNGQTPADVTAQMEHDKIAKLTALEVITGLASQDKIAQMVKDQITDGGQYQQAAYSALFLRAGFIQAYYFGEFQHAQGVINLSQLSAEVDSANNVQYVVDLPFASKIAISVTMLVPADNVQATLDPNSSVSMWQTISADADALKCSLTTSDELKQFNALAQTVSQSLSRYSIKYTPKTCP